MCHTSIYGVVVPASKLIEYFGADFYFGTYELQYNNVTPIVKNGKQIPFFLSPSFRHINLPPDCHSPTEISAMYQRDLKNRDVKVGVSHGDVETLFRERLDNCPDKELWLKIFDGQQPTHIGY